MDTSADAPLFTAQSVVQGLASDSALLLSLVSTIERTASAEQKASFVRHFVSLLLLCRDDGVFAGSELIGELFLLDLDEAMWRQRDPALFLRRPHTIVSALLEQLSRETFTAPEGTLLPHLVAVTRVLSAGDDDSTSSIATPMGGSPGEWSHRSDINNGPLTDAGEQDGQSAYGRFSTSELAGLSNAEQRFYNDSGHSTCAVPPSLGSSVSGAPMTGASSPQTMQQQQQQPAPLSVSSYGVNGTGTGLGGSSGWQDSFCFTRDTDASTESGGGGEAALRTAFTGTQVREAVDFFAEAATRSEPKAARSGETALNMVDVRAEAVLTLAFQIQEVVAKHISDCPLILRRAFWLWLRASSGRSGPPESAEISPELPVMSASARPPPPPLPPAVSFEFVGMATMVMLHMLSPLLLSLPSFVLPVEEEEDSEAYVTTTTRFRFMAAVLQKAAYGLLFSEKAEAGLAPLNRGMRELHRRWVLFFSALADYRNASSMNWCCPLPTPTRGPSTSLAGRAEEQATLHRYFQFLDGFLVPYLQTTVLLRRFTEAIHLPQWLRCTYFASRFASGHLRVVMPGSVPPPSPLLATAASRRGWVSFPTNWGRTLDEAGKLQRMGDAMAHIVERAAMGNGSITDTTVTAFMANFISFLGINAAKVTSLVIYEDLLRRYWAQFPPADAAETGSEDMPVERAEAAAVVSFFIYLAVQHNVVSSRFQLVVIPSVSAALHAEEHTPLWQSAAFSTADTLRWLWQVLEGIPTEYRRHCSRVWTATVAPEDDGLRADSQRDFTSDLPDMPRLKICTSFSELMSTLCKGLSSYVPLSADDYHWMVCEQQRQHLAAGDAAPGSPKRQGDASNTAPPAVPDVAASPVPNPATPPARSAVSAALANTPTLHSLRERWRRPLAVSESLCASGILPLHSTRGLFEVVCTITCRRLWTDGTLQPVAGASALGTLIEPLCAITQLYAAAGDVAATLLNAVDATPPPRWLRDLHFSHGSVSVHVGESSSRRSSALVGASPNTSPTMMQEIDRVHWPRCAWFYPATEESEEAGGGSAVPAHPGVSPLSTQWESLMQHVLFFSSEFDASVFGYDAESNQAEQILSTRWGLSGSGGSPPPPAVLAAEEEEGGPAVVAVRSLHAVPSLRHLSIESMWRLFLFNVRQTCHIVRRTTPRECPFCRMEVAISDVLRGGGGVRKSHTIAVRPGLDEGGASLAERISQAAADALRSCFPSEVTLVRLIVSVAAYIRNVHHVVERIRARGAEVPPTTSMETYKAVVWSGTAQLLYGKEPLTTAQERLVDLICFDGDSLVEKAYLPYYENCTWHPYGRLLFDC